MKKNIYQRPVTAVFCTELTLLAAVSGGTQDQVGDGRAGAKEDFNLWGEGSGDVAEAGENTSFWED